MSRVYGVPTNHHSIQLELEEMRLKLEAESKITNGPIQEWLGMWMAPKMASRWLIDPLRLPAEVKANLAVKTYPGGHMMYHRLESLKADLAGQVRTTMAAGRPARARLMRPA